MTTVQPISMTVADLEVFQFECLVLCYKGIKHSPGFLTVEALTLLALQRSLGLTEEPAADVLILRRMAATAARDGGCYVSRRHKIGQKLHRTVWKDQSHWYWTMDKLRLSNVYGSIAKDLRQLHLQTIATISAMPVTPRDA